MSEPPAAGVREDFGYPEAACCLMAPRCSSSLNAETEAHWHLMLPVSDEGGSSYHCAAGDGPSRPTGTTGSIKGPGDSDRSPLALRAPGPSLSAANLRLEVQCQWPLAGRACQTGQVGSGMLRVTVMRMRGAVRTFGLGCTLPGGAAHTFEACNLNLTRTARAQCTDCIQPYDSELLKCSVRDSPLRLALAVIPDAAAIGIKS